MKIEHVAIWANDIDKVCEFYRKYFGGVVQPLYHNPTKQFTSRFVTFESGARLEVMHRPDIGGDAGTVGTMTESKPDLACVSRETLANRGCDEKFIFRHIRGAASCGCASKRQHDSERCRKHRVCPYFFFSRFERRGGPPDPEDV